MMEWYTVVGIDIVLLLMCILLPKYLALYDTYLNVLMDILCRFGVLVVAGHLATFTFDDLMSIYHGQTPLWQVIIHDLLFVMWGGSFVAMWWYLFGEPMPWGTNSKWREYHRRFKEEAQARKQQTQRNDEPTDPKVIQLHKSH
jgi:hypothetical protein